MILFSIFLLLNEGEIHFHDDWNHDLNQKSDFSCVTKMKLETWGTRNYAT